MAYKDLFKNKTDQEILDSTFKYLSVNKFSIENKCFITVLKEFSAYENNNGNDIIFKTFDAYLSNKLDKIPQIVIRKYKALVKKEKIIAQYELSPVLPKISIFDLKAIALGVPLL